MNLTEYKNQVKPKRGNLVKLDISEINIHCFAKVLPTSVFASVEVYAFKYSYVIEFDLFSHKWHTTGRLMTQNSDGNPKQRSVFILDSEAKNIALSKLDKYLLKVDNNSR